MIDTARHYLDDSTHTTWEQCHRGIPGGGGRRACGGRRPVS